MNRRTIISILVIAVLAMVAIWLANSQGVRDYLLALGYEPSKEVAEIEKNLDLTNEAKGIFNASRPDLESRDDFNYYCSSYDQEISVLGCYTGGKIYLYDVESSELNGVKESTMAHELLHAVWARLSDGERTALSGSLMKLYNEDEKLSKDLQIYDEKNRLDELHSRAATQIANLPSDLEAHYAKYFKNQDKVVAYYSKYNSKFETLSAELERLENEMASIDDEIESKTNEYKTRVEALNSEIEGFNDCANTAGCFSANEFYNRRAELVAEQTSVANLYNEIDQLVKTYNEKVSEYNNNILRTQNLQNSMNSNSAPPAV
ncbi:hypothetical protein IKF33_02195 [Candidatus Saccharibacteria bacterium]|nr:hypothetical protein [Candidatus Saccharibacteria bacterium]